MTFKRMTKQLYPPRRLYCPFCGRATRPDPDRPGAVIYYPLQDRVAGEMTATFRPTDWSPGKEVDRDL